MARTNKKSPESSEPAAADSAATTKAKADAPLSNAEKASPVLTAIGKRLRAARKRLGKIKAIEDIRVEKELNPDQVHRFSILQSFLLALIASARAGRASSLGIFTAASIGCGGRGNQALAAQLRRGLSCLAVFTRPYTCQLCYA